MAEDKKFQLPMPMMMPEIVTPGLTQKQKGNRKHVVWATAAVLIVLVVVTGFALGGYFFSKTTSDMVKHYNLHYKNADGSKVQETIENNEEENTELFHIHTVTGQQWVLKDYNKDIEVYKVRQQGMSTACFISPLNRSIEITPKEINDELAGREQSDIEVDAEETFVTYSKPSSEPIADPSFLGSKATLLCRNEEVYWLFPTCDQQAMDDNQVARTKRGWFRICVRVCVWRYCYNKCWG